MCSICPLACACVRVCAQFSAADESTAVLVEHLERLSDLCTENTRKHHTSTPFDQ